MSIGSNIKYYRELHHLTQKELAEAIGVSDKAVSTWENDKKIPRMGVIQKMADFFNIQKTNIIEDSPNLVTNKVLNSSINTIVAVNLKKIRADKMLRYADISALSGVTKEDLQAFEEGTKRPKSADIRNIELALDLEKGTLKGKKPYIPTGPDESIPTKPNEIVVDNKHIILSPEEYKKLNEFLGRDLKERNEKYLALKKETTELLEKIIDLIYENKFSEEKLKKLNENLKRISENNE